VGGLVLALGQTIFASVRAPLIRLLIGLVYAVPAAVAGYQLCFALSGISGPVGAWQPVIAAAGALMVGLTAFARMAMLTPRSMGQGSPEASA